MSHKVPIEGTLDLHAFEPRDIKSVVEEYVNAAYEAGLREIRITYVPGDRCIELKSLKYYMIEFRNRGIFYEAVTNQILDDLVAACAPRRMTVIGDFSVRGGIKTVVTASYPAPRG